jgi:hypothetical protein
MTPVEDRGPQGPEAPWNPRDDIDRHTVEAEEREQESLSINDPHAGETKFLVRLAFDWDVYATNAREAERKAEEEYGTFGVMSADVEAEGATPYCEKVLPNGATCGAAHDPTEECPYTAKD